MVMSVTVPRRTRFPALSATLTTARTTADRSLFSKLSLVSILACATGAEAKLCLLFTTTSRMFELAGLRSGAWISSSLARGSADGGEAPLKMLFSPLSLFFAALYLFGALYDGLGWL